MPVRSQVLFFLFIVPFLLGAGKPTEHPFHVGVIEIQHNAKTQSLELSFKLFTDDFEKALSNRFKTPIDLISPARHASMDSLVARYIRENFSLTVGEKRYVSRYLGFEQEKEAVFAYVEYPEIASVNGLQADCSLLYETFEDQINIFHVTMGGERKSSKLGNPARRIEFRF
jgi:hypothetical protein